ncbi:P-loop containing nucleoside triphosphate hydrolase protein [Basidiobolus meristosporus CBS 931.73]|uniref:Cell division control protein n=1 Tax=Basidiobolus meristosporus CBS 931.73 TaxID=1314790 RepID=A0A1Y1YZI1_9FUNG|nr:P-loop containing nucleoside triphosphate hydrolase protein [Basidiobolus meristosporus CBS 931.73]|eukprot:ORY03274.1 P-loop containing nucleoside triphosphate hydrolase protein [Basidiobolus meristosporus CBS 931.73]
MSIYQQAKSLFRCSAKPHQLVGREEERVVLMRFWYEHVVRSSPGCLYISGSPGTGKTALLNQLCTEFECEKAEHKVEIIKINCMSISDPRAIYSKLLNEAGAGKASSKDALKSLEKVFFQGSTISHSSNSQASVVILDEIDHLFTKDQDVLYKLFEWPTLPEAHLALIGIANALDLTDRFLPRLRAKNCEPQILNFNPYRVSQIIDIIKTRLISLCSSDAMSELNGLGKKPSVPIMQLSAIELCARKVAAGAGDLRKALSICRQAIEMVELEQKNSVGKEPGTVASAPKVTIKHVMRVVNSMLGSSSVKKVQDLNLQQKLVLLAGVLFSKSKMAEMTLGTLYDRYISLCYIHKYFVPVTRSEFFDLTNMVESTGLIILGKSKGEMLRKVSMNVQEDDIVRGIRDNELLLQVYEEGLRAVDEETEKIDAKVPRTPGTRVAKTRRGTPAFPLHLRTSVHM